MLHQYTGKALVLYTSSMKTCLLIPGNPAIESQYRAWMQEIEHRHPSIHIVYASSYVLFSRRLNYLEYDQAMTAHYEHIFLGLDASEKIILLVHSVGAYFAFRLLEKYPDKIKKVIVLFPYLGHSHIPLLKLISIPYWIDRFFPLAEIVSACTQLFRGKCKDSTSNISTKELTACLRFGVRQCMYFSKYIFDIQSISQYAHNIQFIYTDNDKWCPEETIGPLKSFSKSTKTILPHDFIQIPKYRLAMIEELEINA